MADRAVTLTLDSYTDLGIKANGYSVMLPNNGRRGAFDAVEIIVSKNQPTPPRAGWHKLGFVIEDDKYRVDHRGPIDLGGRGNKVWARWTGDKEIPPEFRYAVVFADGVSSPAQAKPKGAIRTALGKLIGK